jgi:hypothetical protein
MDVSMVGLFVSNVCYEPAQIPGGRFDGNSIFELSLE